MQKNDSCMFTTIEYSARSHMGNVRTNNEDNLYCAGVTLTPETRDVPFSQSGEATSPCLLAVCDGMGGHAQGEAASLAAASALDALAAAMQEAPPGAPDSLVQEYISTVNRQLCEEMREKGLRMGTTLALVVIREDAIYPYNIGDSRIYAQVGGKLSQISREHTVAAQKVEMGFLSQEQARNDPDRHKLTLHLGIHEDELTLSAEAAAPIKLLDNCRVLLCSDGLTDFVSDEYIAEVLHAYSAADAADLLLRTALENGGKDNITCIVAHIKPPDGGNGKTRSLAARFFSMLVRRMV